MSANSKKSSPVRGTNPVLVRFLANLDKNLDKMDLNFKPAFLYKKAGFFCIVFYWRASFDAPFIRFRKTFGLNRIHDLKNREKAAKIMIKSLNEALKDGYNPLNESIDPVAKVVEVQKSFSVLEAFEIGYKLKLNRLDKDKVRTVEAYGYHSRHFIRFLNDCKLEGLDSNSFTAKYAVMYQDWCIDSGLSAVTINTKTEYISTIFKMAAQNECILFNPFANIDKLKEKESTLYTVYTDEQIVSIKSKLLAECGALWQIFLFVFYAYMRPSSIVNLRVRDIDFAESTIFVNGKSHKNGKDQYKQLLKIHADYLIDYVNGYADDYFLFSDGWSPGPEPIKRRKLSDKWNELIIKGLGMDVKLYAAKHSGSSIFVSENGSNENLKWLQMQMSHSSLEMTSIYTNKLKSVKLDESTVNIREI